MVLSPNCLTFKTDNTPSMGQLEERNTVAKVRAQQWVAPAIVNACA
jgi:hypothetical protein